MPQHIFIKNYGCSSNTADAEVLAGCLTAAGYQIAQTEAQADLIIYNTCAVKGPTENRIIADIKQASADKKILVAGCLPKISFERLCREARFDGVVGPSVGKDIVEVAAKVLAGEKVVALESKKEKPPLNLPHKTTNPAVSIVPINFGCLGSCAYCCVVQARGHLRSYGKKEIVERVQADYAAGAREFWITSQDTASYGRDIHTNLAELLLAVCAVEGDFKVRVGMMTPNLVVDIQEQLLAAFSSPKIFKFLHLPVQSGDDSVLKGMRRFYTSVQFKEIVEAFRSEFPDLTLATDVIVGYPGESEEAFQNTLGLLEEVKPDVTNVSKFFARPKTAAWEIKDGLVGKDETKRRSAQTAELAKKLSAECNKRWVGWCGEVLFDEEGKVEGTWVGRNFCYKPIAVKSGEYLLGKTRKVTVTAALGTYLRGELMQEEEDDGEEKIWVVKPDDNAANAE
jgi:threonylcarbamoyladenosine tRNA methylthiotransferase CDKAL1